MRISAMMWRSGASALFGAAVLGLTVGAYADPHGHGPAGHPERAGAPANPDHPDRPGRPDHGDHPDRPGRPDHDDHPDHPNAGLHLGWETETPAQHAARIAARHALEQQIWAAVHKDGKEPTAEERDVVRAQWRRHARLWKIRELAEAAKDTAAVAECDKLLARSDDWAVERLAELNAKAPAGGAK